ncbi:LamG-like jellyroll fold domain-containing protein [Nostoc sp. TCL240-02]|uniref:LamG-like jellyroll fold domain-containing protein n=1 Tax=Nostoc sp. TCL240-02 TaxID=2572090 RepID=UPI00157F86A7|nr:LamG-like jellyroll fold domain-containing protein [Nostoc sp. TCL240-02]QKQ76345.1 LamG domain-containing protein [Nostoc sp. TCL240-02]
MSPNPLQISQLGSSEKLIPDNTDLLPIQQIDGVTRRMSRANFLSGLASASQLLSPIITSKTIFLSHLDSDANGIADTKGTTLTVNGSAALSSSKYILGNKSLYFPGSAYVQSSVNAKFNILGDFSMEAFMWMPSTYDTNNTYASFLTIDNGSADFISVGKNRSGLNNKWYGQTYFNGESVEVYSVSNPPSNTWNHLVFTRVGNVLGLRINGVLESQVLQTSIFRKFGNNNTRVSLGCIPGYLPSSIPALVGAYMSEVRICIGDFPVPTLPYKS